MQKHWTVELRNYRNELVARTTLSADAGKVQRQAAATRMFNSFRGTEQGLEAFETMWINNHGREIDRYLMDEAS